MAHYKISDVAIEINERENNPANSKYERFVGLEHYVSGEVIIRNFGSTERLESTMKVFKSGDVLVARRNVYLKRASTVDFDGLTSGDSIVLRAKTPIMARILPFVLNTDDFWDFADQYSDGTMSKRLSPKTLMNYEFDIPDEDKLEAFADILWAANDARESYQDLICKSDELVKSQFIEMFANQNFEQKTIADLFTLQMGKTPERKEAKFWNSNDYRWISIADLGTYGKYTADTSEYISQTAVDQSGIKIVPKNTVIMSFKLTIGRTAITSEDIYTNEAIMAFLPKTKHFNLDYLMYALRYKDWTEGMQIAVKGATLNKNIIGKATIFIPEMRIQEEFAAFVEQSDKSKFVASQETIFIENLIKFTYKNKIQEEKECSLKK